MSAMMMTAPPAGCSGRLSGPAPAAQQLGFSSSLGGCHHFHRRPALQQRRAPQHSLQVRSALSRARKEETIDKLVSSLETSACVFGVRYKHVSVKEFQDFRRSLPEQSKVIVCKNTLMAIAADKVEGFSPLKTALQEENAWVFADEENLSASVKAYIEFEKKLKEKLPKEQRAAAKPTDISGAVLDGKALDYAGVIRLEKMPTKLELIATIARLIKQVPTKVAVGIKQVPTKLAYGVKALADGDDKDALVGDVFPKADASAES
jgi:large subunit ribosomal protein L10